MLYKIDKRVWRMSWSTAYKSTFLNLYIDQLFMLYHDIYFLRILWTEKLR